MTGKECEKKSFKMRLYGGKDGFFVVVDSSGEDCHPLYQIGYEQKADSSVMQGEISARTTISQELYVELLRECGRNGVTQPVYGEPPLIKSRIKCQACENEEQWVLVSTYGNEFEYHVCSNCLLNLTTYNLSKTQFMNLLRNGHTTAEFLLHGDFYDEEDGTALQSVFE